MRAYIIFFALVILILSSCGEKIGSRYQSKKFDREVHFNLPNPTPEIRKKEITSKDSAGSTIVSTFINDSVLVSTETFDNEKDKNPIGESKYYYPNGKLKSYILYGKTKEFRKLKSYYPSGVLKRECEYLKDSLISGICYDSLGNKTPYYNFEIMPEVDLNKFQSCIVYPQIMKREDCQELVMLRILINKDKKVILLKYDSDNSKEFIEEIIKCIKIFNDSSDSFVLTPYLNDGEAMSCWINIPINFRLR